MVDWVFYSQKSTEGQKAWKLIIQRFPVEKRMKSMSDPSYCIITLAETFGTPCSHGTRTCIKRKKIHYGNFFDFCADKYIYKRIPKDENPHMKGF